MATVKITAAVKEAMNVKVLSLLERTAAGKNPNVTFPFTSIGLPRGHQEHVSHTDDQEVRLSITVEFWGTLEGKRIMHLHMDGTLKSPENLHKEVQARFDEERGHMIQESRCFTLNQTTQREEAKQKLMDKIKGLRADNTKSVIRKQLEKDRATREYMPQLDEQRAARVAAT